MNTNMTGFERISKIFGCFALDDGSLSIGRVNEINLKIKYSHAK